MSRGRSAMAPATLTASSPAGAHRMLLAIEHTDQCVSKIRNLRDGPGRLRTSDLIGGTCCKITKIGRIARPRRRMGAHAVAMHLS
jgi:hypothetical protein